MLFISLYYTHIDGLLHTYIDGQKHTLKKVQYQLGRKYISKLLSNYSHFTIVERLGVPFLHLFVYLLEQ